MGLVESVLLCLLLACTANDEVVDDSPPALTEHVKVEAKLPLIQTETLDPEPIEMGRYPNLALAYEALPGVSGIRRSLNALEPVIRGLGQERVQTQVNGVPMHGACPARMDPPATLVTRSAAEEAIIVKGLASVVLGPAGTGGRLMVSTDHDRGWDPGTETHPWGLAVYNGAQDGYNLGAGVDGGTERFDYSLAFETQRLGDFDSGDGTRVPASGKETGGSLSLGYRTGSAGRVFGSVVIQDGEDIDYPSLPMDADEIDTRLYNVGYRLERADRGLNELTVRVGAGTVDHVMSNSRRPNRGMWENETVSNADSGSAGLGTRWQLSGRSTLSAGLDYSNLKRDALRQRFNVATQMTFYDHLWPDVSQDDLAAFAEYQWLSGSDWTLRFGARFDAVSSDAAAADDPSLGGRTVRENYVYFYGPQAAKTDRDESLPTANFVMHHRFEKNVTIEAGIGLVSRSAGMSERYFAFGMSPKGFFVGNPTLDAERKRELVVGAKVDRERWDGSVSLYYYDFADYITPTLIHEGPVTGLPGVNEVYGFLNVDATVLGGEIAADWSVTRRIDLPLSLAYVYGKNDTSKNPLAEIPAAELRAAARFQVGREGNGWFEVGGRFVARQERVDPEFNEKVTPGYDVWHLRGGLRLAGHLRIYAAIENLFDKEYAEHLTPEAFYTVGDLTQGEKIPQPGRAFHLSARLEY